MVSFLLSIVFDLLTALLAAIGIFNLQIEYVLNGVTPVA